MVDILEENFDSLIKRHTLHLIFSDIPWHLHIESEDMPTFLLSNIYSNFIHFVCFEFWFGLHLAEPKGL